MSRDAATFGAPLIRRIVEECPRRITGSESERRAQEILRAELDALGLETDLVPFRFNVSLYAVLALHFGLAALASLVFFAAPAVALPLHLIAAVSYTLDSGRRATLLRRLFPFVESQNLVAVRPATGGPPALRIALVSHADAAFTGWLFHPEVIRHGTKPPPIQALGFLRKSVRVATVSVFLLAALDLWAILGGPPSLGIVVAVLSIPALIALVLNTQVVLKSEVVPGANDNLSGCAAAVVLADRLADAPSNVELVYVATGAEESGCGGSWSLARDVSAGRWSRDHTVVLGIDGMSNGTIRFFEDGEVLPMPIAPWLRRVVEQTAASDPRFAEVEHFDIPSGATDCSPFLARGYDAVCIGCVDSQIGAPREYHRPSDTPDNLDVDQLALSVDFVEQLVRAVIRDRLEDHAG